MPPRKASPLKAVGGTGRPRKAAPARAAKAAPKSVKAAAESGVRRDLLIAMRARIASDLDDPNTPPRDIAALSRRLLEIAKDVEALDAAEKRDPVGDAAATPDADWASS